MIGRGPKTSESGGGVIVSWQKEEAHQHPGTSLPSGQGDCPASRDFLRAVVIPISQPPSSSQLIHLAFARAQPIHLIVSCLSCPSLSLLAKACAPPHKLHTSAGKRNGRKLESQEALNTGGQQSKLSTKSLPFTACGITGEEARGERAATVVNLFPFPPSLCRTANGR